MKKFLWVIVLGFSISRQTNCAPMAGNIKIMPLGNSITHGAGFNDSLPMEQIGGYRWPLFTALKTSGIHVDFIGSQNTGKDLDPTFDPDHAGFPCYSTRDLRDLLKTGMRFKYVRDSKGKDSIADTLDTVTQGPYLYSYSPDLILLHIGTNDIPVFPISQPPTIAFVDSVLDLIDAHGRSRGKEVAVCLATIVNRKIYNSITRKFNDSLRILVDRRKQRGANIFLADMEKEAGIDYQNEMADLLHPGPKAYHKMARVWYDAITPLFSDMPSPFIVPKPGIYLDSVQLVLSKPIVDAVIRYTLDGTEPNQTSTLYSAPFSLKGDQVFSISARAYSSDGNRASPIAKADYCVQYDQERPRLLSAANYAANQVYVEFSKPLDPATAQSATNYAINKGIVVTGAVLQAGSQRVILTTSSLTPNQGYVLTVNNVCDRSLKRNLIAPNSQTVFYGMSEDPFMQNAGTDGLVCFEAEHFHDSVLIQDIEWKWVTTKSKQGCSGDGAMQLLPNTGGWIDSNLVGASPRLDFKVNFSQAGTYVVWTRGLAPYYWFDDGYHLGLNLKRTDSSDYICGFTTEWTWSKATIDDVEATLSIPTPGTYTLHAWMMIDGFVLDKIVLTKNKNYIPSQLGPCESLRMNANQKPVFESAVDTTINVGENLQFSVKAIDPEGQPVAYWVIVAPDGLGVESVSGVVTWTPNAIHANKLHEVCIAGGDGDVFETLDFHINVKGDAENEAWMPKNIPTAFALQSNHPNPFNPVTRIDFAVPRNTLLTGGNQRVMIMVLDNQGRFIKTIVDGIMAPGYYSAVFDGVTAKERPTASNLFYCRMQAKGFTKTIKMLLVK